MVTVLRAGDHRRMPWKNGGGVTTEIAVYPPDATIDDFGWRVSMAAVAADGPFSVFPGIDRTLAILDGEGIELDIAGRQPAVQTRQSLPLAFPADIATSAVLVSGPINDLNVMTRRGAFEHRVVRLAVDGDISLETRASTTLLLSTVAALCVSVAGDEPIVLDRTDAMILDGPAGAVLTLSGRGDCYLISIGPV